MPERLRNARRSIVAILAPMPRESRGPATRPVSVLRVSSMILLLLKTFGGAGSYPTPRVGERVRSDAGRRVVIADVFRFPVALRSGGGLGRLDDRGRSSRERGRRRGAGGSGTECQQETPALRIRGTGGFRRRSVRKIAVRCIAHGVPPNRFRTHSHQSMASASRSSAMYCSVNSATRA